MARRPPARAARDDSFERLRADLSTAFINLRAEQVEVNLVGALARIAEYLGLDRATVYELSQTNGELTATTWACHGANPEPTIARADDPVRWRALLERAGVLEASGHDTPPDAWTASVPLEIGGETIGVLAVAGTTRNRPWTDGLLAQLLALADIFSNAVMRKRLAHALLAGESELHESEERFRLVADVAPVMIWISDTTRLCTYFNRSWLDFVGRPMSAEVGNGWVQGVHADDLSGCLETYTQAFDRRESFTMQYRLRRHDGEYRWLKDTGVPRFDRNGAFDGYIGSCIDVTNEKLAEETLATFGGRLMEAQEQERTRIARDLHDDICQRLTVLAMEVQQLGDASVADIRTRSDEIFNRAVDIADDVQALSHELHSSKLEYLGIVAAIRGFCVEFAEQQEATIDFTLSGMPTHLPRDVSLCLYRVLQEGLRNAVKHSGVRHVDVQLHGTPAVVALTITDRGRGFEPEVAIHGHGLGLISMRERVGLVRGTLLIKSKPEWGTEIGLRVPVDASRGRSHKSANAIKHVYRIRSDRAS